MQKKDTPTRRKGSSQKRDPLAPYRKEANHIIKLIWDDENTPDFVIDLLEEWLTELESQTQVFYNRREIAVVALPLMLQAAAEMGIDYMARGSCLYIDAMGTLHGRRDEDRDSPLVLARQQREQEQRELERDAEAIARIINSPRVPAAVKNTLAQAVLTFMDDFNEHPDVLRAQWPLAVLQAAAAEKAEAQQ